MNSSELLKCLSIPSAPFREGAIRAFLEAKLARAGVPSFRDPHGNLVVGARSEAEYRRKLSRKGRRPLRLFVAHMDHPGFHGLRWTGERRFSLRWHGGGPRRHWEGASVWISIGEEGRTWRGRLRDVKAAKGAWPPIRGAQVELSARDARELRESDAAELFGGLDFGRFAWRDGALIRTKAADDLVGAWVVSELAIAARGKPEANDFLGILTRGEEVGYVGALAHLQEGYFRRAGRPLVLVSIETSRTLPGAEIGAGPVVRLGDKTTVFDPAWLQTLLQTAERALPGQHQRRVMNGGTCEATAALAFGVPAVGISVPLGNYHNESFEGGPGSRGPRGPAPEFVHLKDIERALKLARAYLKAPIDPSKAWDGVRREILGDFRPYRAFLKERSRGGSGRAR